jgi:hypothetical protein
MPALEPCPGCQRHVRTDEHNCPFCGMAVADHMARQKPRAIPRVRLGRAALFAFGVSTASAPLLACNGDDDDNGADAGSGGDGDSAGDGDQSQDAGGGGIQPVYGVPPGDGDGSGDGDGDLPDAGMVGGDGDDFDGGWGIPIYGAAPNVIEKK